MPAVEQDIQAVRRQVDRLLENVLFARSEQLSRLLRFLVERHLDGRDFELKESVIGVEVFGRRPDYNPKFDPIVRTEVRRLRARLTEYYQGVGKGDPISIEIPKGAYVPVVRPLAPAQSPEAPQPPQWRSRPVLMVGAGLTVALMVMALTSLAPRHPVRPHNNSPAYELYVRARAFEVAPNLSGIESSIDLFQQAIAKDSSFAPAYAGVAAGYAARSGFDRFDPQQRADMLARGWAAAKTAVQLDPRLADAHDAVAMMQARQAQWKLAERSFRHAIELAPRDVLWREHLVMFLLLPLGRAEEAIRELRVSEEIDPKSPQTHSLLHLAKRAEGRFDESVFHCQQAAPNDQARSACFAENLQQQGKSDEAIRILEPVWNGHLMEPGAQALGIAYAKAGRRADAERVAAMLPRLASRAQIFAALGDKDRTFELLDQMTPFGPARIGRDFLLSPNFSFLRGDPRLVSLRKKVGLPVQN
jgi:tetratricopeptide (TPR) repeat protein